MLCNSINEEQALQLNETDFKANIKFDGERILSIVVDNDVILINRRGKICNMHFQEVVEDLKKLPNCIIDGEIISLNDDFQMLQRRALTKTLSKIPQLQKDVPVKYMVFDLLGIGKATNKLTLPLKDRITELQNLFSGLNFNHTELVEYGDIKNMLEKAKLENREGIIVKDLNAKYENRRCDSWRKLKFFKETTITITKYTQNPKGIRVEDDEGNACQIAGEQHKPIKEMLDKGEKVEIYIQYLSQGDTGRYRFPSFRGVVKKENGD
jgi:ATP-dependent DNA ligase